MTQCKILPLAAAVLAVAVLSGCGKHDAASGPGGSGPVDAGKVVDVAAAQMHPQPGRWEATVKISHMALAGMSPQLRVAMQRGLAGGTTIATCLTPAEAARPSASFFSGRRHDCVYDSFTMADGKLNAVMHCSAHGTQMTSTMTGTYDEKSYVMHGSSSARMPGGQTMSQDMDVTSQWVGACTGTEVPSRPTG